MYVANRLTPMIWRGWRQRLKLRFASHHLLHITLRVFATHTTRKRYSPTRSGLHEKFCFAPFNHLLSTAKAPIMLSQWISKRLERCEAKIFRVSHFVCRRRRFRDVSDAQTRRVEMWWTTKRKPCLQPSAYATSPIDVSRCASLPFRGFTA